MRKLSILCLSIFIVGCATARAIRYPNVYYYSTDPNTIGIYYNFPPGDYEVIGEVAGSGAPAAGWNAVGKFMREEAAKIGGHAIVIQQAGNVYAGTYVNPGSVTGRSMGTWIGNTYYGQTTYSTSPGYAMPMYAKEARGIIIRFKDRHDSGSMEVVRCPNGHEVDCAGFPEGTDVRCPVCNMLFKYGNSEYDSTIKKEPKVIKCPKGHLFLYKEGIDILQCNYCEKNYKIEECSIIPMAQL